MPPPSAADSSRRRCIDPGTVPCLKHLPGHCLTHTDALGTDFRALHSELLSFGGYRNAGTRSLPAAQLTPEWLQQNGAFRPTLIPAAPAAARELGIALPEGSLTVDRLASRLGIATEVGG